ncbi:MAG: sugar phosphate isomerase/epimerase family protein [bacterium]|nr:sugar phosphate isomerase/epimerase family protein [bacterium]
MSFGMPTLIECDSLEDTLELCKELGLDFVELNMNLPQYQVDQLKEVKHLQKLTNRYQSYYTVHLDENLNVSDFNKEVAKAYQNTVLSAIQVAKILAIPILNMHMNHGVHFTLPDRKVQLFQQYEQEYLREMIQFRKMCETAIGTDDIKLCIENTEGFYPYEINAIDMLLESKVFGLTWDIGHSHTAKEVDEPLIRKRQSRLSHFHIHDALEEQNHMILGSGEINVRERLDLARKLECRCVIETKTVEALKKSVDWLREEKYL